MASVSDIANLALGHVGDDSVVVNVLPPNVDNTPAAGYCARYYPLARRMLIEMFPWRFATKRVALAASDPIGNVWPYAYIKPSDAVHIVKVLSASTFAASDSFYSERGSALADVQNGLILTGEPDAWVLYRYDVTDTTKYTPTFVTALSYLLASFIAGPIVKGSEGIRLAQGLRETALSLATGGAVLDVNASQEENEFTPGSVAARSGIAVDTPWTR